MTHKDHLETLIAEGNLKQAIKELLEATKLNGQKDLHSSIIMQAASFNRNEAAKRESTISQDNYDLTWNRVRSALLHYVEEEYKDNGKFEFLGEVQPPENDKKISGDTIIGNGNIIIKDTINSNISIQKADKIYNIDKIDNANFS